MTEEIEKKEESETKIKLSDFIENITFIEFRSKGKAYEGQNCNGYITCTIHGINFIEMSQKFFEWIKNNKEFQELEDASALARKL
jgi:hypothetical protein